jgi:hypothetical protein
MKLIAAVKRVIEVVSRYCKSLADRRLLGFGTNSGMFGLFCCRHTFVCFTIVGSTPVQSEFRLSDPLSFQLWSLAIKPLPIGRDLWVSDICRHLLIDDYWWFQSHCWHTFLVTIWHSLFVLLALIAATWSYSFWLAYGVAIVVSVFVGALDRVQFDCYVRPIESVIRLYHSPLHQSTRVPFDVCLTATETILRRESNPWRVGMCY